MEKVVEQCACLSSYVLSVGVFGRHAYARVTYGCFSLYGRV